MRHLLLLVTSLLAVWGCKDSGSTNAGDGATNAVYYWRTELRLNDTERQFLEDHNINKMYCRYFDVVMSNGEPVPNATLRFNDTLPQGITVVPVVYITEDVMHNPHEGLAHKLVERIVQMNETNGITGVNEIQIDCDYTARSRKQYYDFLTAVANSCVPSVASDRRSSASLFTLHFSLLSTTIRLHQLRMPAPPADYGVLMMYNTGDPRNFEQRNPILDIRDVDPYLRYLRGYKLPLAVAYPVYRWQRNIFGVNVEHTVEADEILRVKRAVEQRRPQLKQNIILYHLDKENINRYTKRDYEEIYRH